MLDKIFENFGLKQEHSDIYLTLLEGGILPAGKLAKKLGLPRSTVYGLLEDMARSGLVLQNEKESIKLWQAVNPENITSLLNEKINSLENSRMSFELQLDGLKKSQKTDFMSPKFHYYEGAEEMRIMLKDVLLYNDLITELCWPVKDGLRVLGADFLHEFNLKRIKRNINIKVIWPPDKIEDITKNIFFAPGKEVRREVRIAPVGVDFSMGYWAYAGKVMFMSSQSENFGFIVESKELRQLIKTQFEVLWQVSKPLHGDPEIAKKFLKEL
jgi:sugar-specific transcriptional regulator TrmB